MIEATQKRNRRFEAAAFVVLLLPAAIPLSVIPAVKAASAPTKNMTFYMHYASNPPQVGGVVTNCIFDTKNAFRAG